MRYALTLALALAACFTAQTLALRAVGGRTTKSESNYFSSLGRIQAGAKDSPEVMFLGSSITGRLPDRAQGFPGTANMGCDGGSAVDSLRAMDAGILTAAPQLVIEANTLHLALAEKPTEISGAMRAPWFKVGLHISNLSAYARPSAFLYSKLLAGKIGGYGQVGSSEDLGVGSSPSIPDVTFGFEPDPRQAELIHEITSIFGRLKAKGTKVMIVWLPPARGDDSPPAPWILEIARQSRVPYWDLGQEAADGTVVLTDGVHMAAPSAARTLVSFGRILGK